MNHWDHLFKGIGMAFIAFWGISGCFWGKEPEVIRASAIQHFKKGNAAFGQRDYQEAIMSYHKAIEMDSQTAEFHYNLGLSYYYVAKYQHALTAFQNALKLAHDMAETYYNMALIYNKLYDPEKAHKFYNQYQDLMTVRQNNLLQSQRKQAQSSQKTQRKNQKVPLKKSKTPQRQKSFSSTPQTKKNIQPVPRKPLADQDQQKKS